MDSETSFQHVRLSQQPQKAEYEILDLIKLSFIRVKDASYIKGSFVHLEKHTGVYLCKLENCLKAEKVLYVYNRFV